MTPALRTPLDWCNAPLTRRSVALAALCDDKSVKRYAAGRALKPSTIARIERVLAERGLPARLPPVGAGDPGEAGAGLNADESGEHPRVPGLALVQGGQSGAPGAARPPAPPGAA